MMRRKKISDNVLLIFLKYPQAGRVKTRLAKVLGPQEAASLYRLFVRAVLERTAHKAFERVILFDPPGGRQRMSRWLGGKFWLRPQRKGCLGERLSAAFAWAFRQGAKRVVVIGTDSPTVHHRLVRQAFKILGKTPCVIGPALDGGYYLIGLTRVQREVFEGVSWSSRLVLKQTLRRLKALDMEFKLLEPQVDVDCFEDLAVLRKRLKTRRSNGPRKGCEEIEAALASLKK